MLLLARRTGRFVRSEPTASTTHRRYSVISHGKQHDPLRILFCGADDFSSYSLRALHDLQQVSPEKIAGIDVVCRPDKPVGRGLKKIQEVPIKRVANELELDLHQIDTFKGWQPPVSINLVVAVSFGLLVPARILNGAKYGGLNVHPSLLPDLRGPAPIIHTLLKHRSHTGVTLQTMHPTRFDHGAILDQTPTPGIRIPAMCTPDEVLRLVGPLGAEMLCRSIERGLFLSPVKDAQKDVAELGGFDHAPKITPEDRHIDWKTWTVEDIVVRDRVLGRLWDAQTYLHCREIQGSPAAKRITFHGPWIVESAHKIDQPPLVSAGQPVLIHDNLHNDWKLGIWTRDGRPVCPTSATIEGEGKAKGLPALIKFLQQR